MTWTPAKANPTEPGWYVVKIRLSERPLVLWWGKSSTQWRAGATLQNVVAYIGPLP